ncbi:MAG: Ig-like domain-containing protein [Candidatus Saccharimonadales bacterium]
MGKQLVRIIRRGVMRGSAVGAVMLLVVVGVPATTFAASQQLYLSPNSYTQTLGSEFDVPIRLNTTTPVDAVTVTVTFNPKLLQYVSVDATASAFPISLWSQSGNGNVSIDRGILGGTVNTDSLVATVRFKALTPIAYTHIALKGNTTYGGKFTNPATANARVVIEDTKAPEVYSLKPASGTKSSTSFSISAAARDNIKTVKTEIYIDDKLVHTNAAWNISYTWDIRPSNVTKGVHTVTAKAYDAAGNISTASVTLHKM